jgi:uncharacterized protein
MKSETHPLPGSTPGLHYELTVLRFGTPGARPKVTIQAALHADEVPAMLVAQALRERLLVLEAAGELIGEVQLLPAANPIGLGQRVLGHHEGRFDLRDGINFNRDHADLADAAAASLQGRLGNDEATNVSMVRHALLQAALALPASNPSEHLKRRLIATAIDSDIVLDLHCDTQAVMHLYALTPHEALAEELGALLGAQAILLANESGDWPFDEACSRPWVKLQERFANHPIPPACFAPTVELRGECDTDDALAAQDAEALLEFLRRRGALAGTPAPLPEPLCRATPLAGSEPLIAQQGGVLVFHKAPGDMVAEGEPVASVVDVLNGERHSIAASGAGRFYARIATRWAAPGQRIGKVAGTRLVRSGKLLSA